jgi:isopentenyldiphosphate isomerase
MPSQVNSISSSLPDTSFASKCSKDVKMPAVSEDMLLDQVNQADIPIGHVRRRDVFAERAGFRVAHVLIFDSRGQLLLQRLALSRNRNPGAWGSSVASYLFASESYDAAAIRRLREELGVTTSRPSFFGKTEMMDDGCLKFICVFTLKHDGPFAVDRSHIGEVEFVLPLGVQQMIDDGTRQFTPTFLQVFRYYRSRSL